MTRRQRAIRPTIGPGRDALIAIAAARSGQTIEEVAEHFRLGTEAGYLIETGSGWRLALPAELASDGWTGPITDPANGHEENHD